MKKRMVYLFSLILILPGLTPPSSAAQANTQKLDFSGPISTTIEPHPCTGEVIRLDGRFKQIIRITEDGAGGFHMTSHIIVKGTAVGLTSGNEYVFNQESHLSMNDSQQPCQQEFTNTLHLNFISKGRGENLVLSAVGHITMNANCEVSADLNHFRLECQG